MSTLTNTRQLLKVRIYGTEKIRKISTDNVVELSAIPRKPRLPEKQKSENKSAESLVPSLGIAILTARVTTTSAQIPCLESVLASFTGSPALQTS